MGRGEQKTAVLVPVKPFSTAKSRLSTILTPAEREQFARSMARTVLEAAKGLRVAVIAPGSALDVRRFALINGARFLAEPLDGGIDAAVQSGVEQLALIGYERVIVVHSDLPRVTDISWLADTNGVIIVPDRTGKGTNAISVPTSCGFNFSYGSDSMQRHNEEAVRLGFDPKVVIDPEGISADVDEPADMAQFKIARSVKTR